MDIAEAFPVCSAKVFHEDEEGVADLYCVTRADAGNVRLEAPPAQLSQPIPEVGETVLIQSLLPDAAFQMPARVIAREERDWVSIVCEQSGEILRIQRRNKHRLVAEFPLSVTPRDGETIHATTADLNSEGLRFTLSESLAPASTVIMALDLRDGADAVICDANVVRCRTLGEGKFEAGLQFLGLNKLTQQRIVEVLLRQMFEL
jgi:c-di-GMP-binding flagellar brake protein YcgR